MKPFEPLWSIPEILAAIFFVAVPLALGCYLIYMLICASGEHPAAAIFGTAAIVAFFWICWACLRSQGVER